MRTPFISGNWKMYKTISEAVDSMKRIVEGVGGMTDRDIMIAPPFPALQQVCDQAANTTVFVGAQNLHWEKEGAFTGEISAPMIKAAGCDYVIIGHSERRTLFGETDETVNRKIKAAIDADLAPVLCVGETTDERKTGKMNIVLDNQIRNGLQDLFSEKLDRLVVAYEPVWAIGTGLTASVEQAEEAHLFIRTLIGEILDREFSNQVRILYGGSVKPGNIKGLMEMPDIDGVLVGGASLDPESFVKIVKFEDQD